MAKGGETSSRTGDEPEVVFAVKRGATISRPVLISSAPALMPCENALWRDLRRAPGPRMNRPRLQGMEGRASIWNRDIGDPALSVENAGTRQEYPHRRSARPACESRLQAVAPGRSLR